MGLRYSVLVLSLVAVAAVGCSLSQTIPGLGGDGSGESLKSAQSSHQEVPEGVSCYVCHKDDIPSGEFHAQYGRSCEECHGQTTWVAYKYPHEQWELGIHRQMQCGRCHTDIAQYDFSTWQCWGCHHEEQATLDFHKELGYDDIGNCTLCHRGTPTGEETEEAE